jgi:hypothetical protein
MELTPQQKRKLLATQSFLEKGDLALLEKVLEFQDEIEDKKEEIDSVLEKSLSELSDFAQSLQNGKDGKDGRDGRDGRDGLDGKNGKDGKDGKNGIDGFTPIKGIDYLTDDDIKNIALDVMSQLPEDEEETGEEIINKINDVKSDTKIDASHIKNLPQLTQTVVREQINMGGFETPIKAGTGTTVTKDAFGAYVVSATASGSGHTIQDEGSNLTQRTKLNFVGAGVTVTDDSGNDATIVTISTSAGAGYQAVTGGSVNGSNTVFTWAVAPNAISVDGIILRKTASDGTTNWTGTTSTTLSVAPNFDIFGVA